MTDKELVERLNAYSAQYQNHGGITAEAADRIEQLRAELYFEKIDNTKLKGELATVAAERDRYKAVHENPQPSTNADRIRAMSDDELAKFLATKLNDDFYGCPDLTLQWLQQPAEEADHESNSEP